jgi:hypothetical protein
MESRLQPIRTEPHIDDDALTPPPSPEMNNTTDKFNDLTKYPSFQCLALVDKTDVIGKINSMLARGKAEKW